MRPAERDDPRRARDRGARARQAGTRVAAAPARVWDAVPRSSAAARSPAALQPRPILLGGHLVIQAAPRGAFHAGGWPRMVPAAGAAGHRAKSPTLDELLAAGIA